MAFVAVSRFRFCLLMSILLLYCAELCCVVVGYAAACAVVGAAAMVCPCYCHCHCHCHCMHISSAQLSSVQLSSVQLPACPFLIHFISLTAFLWRIRVHASRDSSLLPSFSFLYCFFSCCGLLQSALLCAVVSTSFPWPTGLTGLAPCFSVLSACFSELIT